MRPYDPMSGHSPSPPESECLQAVRRSVGAVLLLLAVSVPLASCNRPDPLAREDILASVGEEVLTTAEFAEAMARRGVHDEAGKRSLLDELVREMRIVHAAREQGLEDDPEVRAAIRSVLIGAHRAHSGQADETAPLPSEEEVQAYFNEHQDEFRIPPRIRVAMIRIAIAEGMGDDARAKARNRMEEALGEARSSSPEPHFGALSVKYSEDQESRYQGGDLGYVTPEDGRLPPTVFAAAMELEPGGLSSILETSDGLYLLKLIEKTPESIQPFRLAAPSIRSKLQSAREQTRETAYFRELERIPAHIAPDRLGTLKTPERRAEATPPPSVP